MFDQTHTKISSPDDATIKVERNDFDRLEPIDHEKNLSILGTAGGSIHDDSRVMVRRVVYSERNELEISHYLKVYYVLSGTAYATVNDASVILTEKEIMFISPAAPHLFSVRGDARVAVILLPPALIKGHFGKVVEYQSRVATFITNAIWGDTTSTYMIFGRSTNSYVYNLFDMLISEQSYPGGQSEVLKSNLFLCLIGYLSSCTPAEYELSASRLSRSEQIPKILNYIKDNFRTVTLEKVAENFHYTVPYVSKLIRNTTGLTFTEILRETRFDICRALLVNSDMKINRIAEVAGFQNTDHFNRIFKKRMGITPSDYKKNKESTKT